jgi:hypothetical protein
MSRTSNDIYINGLLVSGYDYTRQAWVVNGVYVRCGHGTRPGFEVECQCYGRLHEGEVCTQTFMQDIENVSPRGWNAVQGGSSVSTFNPDSREVR